MRRLGFGVGFRAYEYGYITVVVVMSIAAISCLLLLQFAMVILAIFYIIFVNRTGGLFAWILILGIIRLIITTTFIMSCILMAPSTSRKGKNQTVNPKSKAPLKGSVLVWREFGALAFRIQSLGLRVFGFRLSWF